MIRFRIGFLTLHFLRVFFLLLSSHIGTPTSLLFAQDPDMSQMNVLKDCSNHALGHELVPIVTMNEQMMPEVLDSLPPPPPMQIQMISMPQQSTMQMQQSPIQPMPPPSLSSQPLQVTSSQGMTGVYTLTEEPELEAEENTSM